MLSGVGAAGPGMASLCLGFMPPTQIGEKQGNREVGIGSAAPRKEAEGDRGIRNNRNGISLRTKRSLRGLWDDGDNERQHRTD